MCYLFRDPSTHYEPLHSRVQGGLLVLLLGAGACQRDLSYYGLLPGSLPHLAVTLKRFFSVLHLCISSNKRSFHPNTYRDSVTNITSVLEEEEEEGVEEEGLGGSNNKEALPIQVHWCQD